ncbi:hypothetical protein EYF88_11335 [Paracoccus sediminis]|uniref:Uncharacterized protein n=1 Tax=Paracoccus sediminis TaxID=1214787 RepID=A0A238XDY5_9RHOB|nr:hypothetical protein [Paracoccus sediminis]TBN49652.1 hypothetical protein EYF88_11335 [Paracoccus sediminis]SNR56808.1 hypothetical protein SAMN06265378_10989 [Paracoccus sediminis]
MNTPTEKTAEMQIEAKFRDILAILKAEATANCDPLQYKVADGMALVAVRALYAAMAAAKVRHVDTTEEALTALCEPLLALWDGEKLTLPAHWYAEANEEAMAR